MGFDAIYPKGKYLARWEWIAYDLLPLPFLIDHHHRLFRRTYSTGRYRSGDSACFLSPPLLPPPFRYIQLPAFIDIISVPVWISVLATAIFHFIRNHPLSDCPMRNGTRTLNIPRAVLGKNCGAKKRTIEILNWKSGSSRFAGDECNSNSNIGLYIPRYRRP